MPKLPETTPKRKKMVCFRVDEETHDLLTEAATKANQSVAALCRSAAIELLRERGYIFG